MSSFINVTSLFTCADVSSVPFAAKYGVDPGQCVEVVRHVKSECPNLVFAGLMTIGMKDYSSTPENFKVIR